MRAAFGFGLHCLACSLWLGLLSFLLSQPLLEYRRGERFECQSGRTLIGRRGASFKRALLCGLAKTYQTPPFTTYF